MIHQYDYEVAVGRRRAFDEGRGTLVFPGG